MKLKILAAVIAGTFALPMVAQAGTIADTMSIDGDIGVFYSDSSEEINEIGSEINFDGSAEQDGITYMGHMELDINGTGNSSGDLRMDEVRVGAKGGFGEVWLGEIDNACDQFDPGADDIWLGGQSISCKGEDASSILYKNKFGAAEFAVSHNPNDRVDSDGKTLSESQSAIGARFGMGPVKVNLGYEDGVSTSEGNDEGLVSFGIAGNYNGVSLNVEGNDDDQWGANASYTMNGNTFWLGYGDDNTNDRVGVGFRKRHGKMDYIIEHQDHDKDGDETLVGLRYRF